MRKRTLAAGLALAALTWLALEPTSFDHLRRDPRGRSAVIDGPRRPVLRGAELAAAAGAAPMPATDARIEAFLAQHELDADVEAELVELARMQRVTYAPRDATGPESPDARQARRAGREAFRTQVRETLAAMTPDARAAMRRHSVSIVRLAQTVEAGIGGAP
jgi:hypothetical protein